jgi:molybdenum cofactor biosynthesis protein MoaC
LKKGDAFTVAKIAGVMAAKKTSDLIPLCHTLSLEHIEIRFQDRAGGDGFLIDSEVMTTAKTGVEMEALTAAAVAALTLYDMAKGYDPAITVRNIHLIKKTGGKKDYDQSGNYHSE